jgi:hypothetical protein
MQLTGTSDIIRVVTSASGAVAVHASWVDNNSGVITPNRTNTASITGTTTTTVVGSPSSSHQIRVRQLIIRNTHASTTNTVTVQHYDGTNSEDVFKATLLAGESIVYTDVNGFVYYDANGCVKPATYPGATQSDQEGASSNSVAVTPAVQHYHPSACKAWGQFGVAADIAASYNITSLADTGTGRVTVTIATDFSSVAYACIAGCERSSTTTTVASARDVDIRNATQAAGTIELDCWDKTATNNALADPTKYHMAAFGDQ